MPDVLEAVQVSFTRISDNCILIIHMLAVLR